MKARCGNGVPSFNVRGNALAAASATTPRIPVHPTTKTWFDAGFSYACRSSFVRTHHAVRAAGYIHTRRSTIKIAENPSAYKTSVTLLCRSRPPNTYGSCSPIITNTRPFSRNSSASHTATACSRTPGENIAELCRVTSSPHTTTAITPDACTASPPRYAAYGTINDRAISTGPSSTQRSNQVTMSPTIAPTIAPPTVSHRNISSPRPRVGVVPSTTISTPNCRASSPVASFSRLSPSSKSTMRCGMPTLRAIEVAATASVGDTTAPSRNPNLQSNPGNHQCAANATPIAVKNTSSTARLEIDAKLYLNSRHDVCHAEM